MEEVIYRRYSRLLKEEQPLPDLIVIDGGKGQLSAAMKSLSKLGLEDKIEIISIAKRLEEIFKPGEPEPLMISKRASTLKMIQHIRNEAHRFGITHHRKRRDKGTIKTELDVIDGIGPNLAQKLLKHFKSVKKISEATEAELVNLIGKNKGKLVKDYFG
jgi:excinuclease ABC subunit C